MQPLRLRPTPVLLQHQHPLAPQRRPHQQQQLQEEVLVGAVAGALFGVQQRQRRQHLQQQQMRRRQMGQMGGPLLPCWVVLVLVLALGQAAAGRGSRRTQQQEEEGQGQQVHLEVPVRASGVAGVRHRARVARPLCCAVDTPSAIPASPSECGGGVELGLAGCLHV